MIDSWTFNKIAGAVLGSALFAFGLGEVSSAVYYTHGPSHEKPGYKIEIEEAVAGGGAGAPAVSLGTLLAAADAAKGASVAKDCVSCHSFEKGGPNKTGPDLWDVVERPKAAHEGFTYSDALKAMSADKWTYQNLDAFLKNPKSYVSGTKMAYGGIRNDARRANLIAYLATLSDSPKPFPAP